MENLSGDLSNYRIGKKIVKIDVTNLATNDVTNLFQFVTRFLEGAAYQMYQMCINCYQ